MCLTFILYSTLGSSVALEKFKDVTSIVLEDGSYYIHTVNDESIPLATKDKLLFSKIVRVINDTEYESDIHSVLYDVKTSSIGVYADGNTLYYRLSELNKDNVVDYNGLIPEVGEGFIVYDTEDLEFSKDKFYISISSGTVSLNEIDNEDTQEIELYSNRFMKLNIDGISENTHLIAEITNIIKESAGTYTFSDIKKQ